MERSIDSDYVDLSHMGGFDMGIDFDGFEENVKKFMELQVKYLDSAHDKAVEFIEDVQAIFFSPFTDDEVLDKEDQSGSTVIECSPTYVESELVGPNTEASTPASLITVENSSTGCVDADAHETESFSSKSTDSSEEVILWNPETAVKPRRPCALTTIPQDDHAPHALETDQVAEQIGFLCSGHSDYSVSSREMLLEDCSENYEEEVVLHSANDQYSTIITQDDYVPHSLHTDQQAGLHYSVHSDILVDSAIFFQALLLEDSTANYEEEMVSYSANGLLEATKNVYVPQESNKEEQSRLHCSGHSDSAGFFDTLLLEDSTTNFEEQMISYSANGSVKATTHGTGISHESNLDVPICADDPNMMTDNMVKFVDADLGDGQEHIKNDKIEVHPVYQRQNASFQRMFMRSLSSKLRWSKKQASTHQAMPAGSQDAENIRHQMASSSDDLEDGWEVL